jgi:plastocyanin
MGDDLRPYLARKEEEQPSTFSETGMFWLLIILMLILLAFAVTIFGPRQEGAEIVTGSTSPSPTESRQPRIYTVSYRNGVFSPTNLRIHAGDTVRFRNDGNAPVRVVGDNNEVPGFDSVGDIQSGSAFGFTFATKGIFGYHNERNVNETGTIMVR